MPASIIRSKNHHLNLKIVKGASARSSNPLHKRSETKYRSFFDNSMDGMLLTDTDGQILAANAAACELFKMTEEEICKAGRFGLVDAGDIRLLPLIEERRKTGRAKGEITFVRKDGSRFQGEVSSSIFENDKGEDRTSMIIRDVTSRIEAEQTLRKSEAFTSGLINSLHSHIAVINSAGIIIKVNKPWNTFAINNGATVLEKFGEGANYFDACEAKNISADDDCNNAINGIKKVLAGTLNEFCLEYPCHSPQHERWFFMRAIKFESDETLVLIEHHDISERKKAGEKLGDATNELQKALNDLEKIMDSSLDVICTIDEEGNFVNVSAASEANWGYKPGELVGRKFIDMVVDEDAEKTIKATANVKQGIPVTFFENCYRHKDGRDVAMIWSAKWDEDNKLIYCIGKNATSKKRLEKAFEIERQRFVDLFLRAPSCVGVLQGPGHIFAMANPLYLQLIGKSDITGKSLKQVLPEAEEQGFVKILDAVYKTGETFTGNEMLFKLDKHGTGKADEMFLNLIYQAYKNNEGKVDGIFFFIVDVTEQVLSRKKLEESEKQYVDLIQNLPAAIYSTNEKGDIKIYNKAAVKLWGREPDKEKDKWIGAHKIYRTDGSEILHDESPMALTLKEGKAKIYGELIVKQPDGTLKNVIPHPIPLFDEIGKLTGAINMLIDVSEIRKFENALAKSEKNYRQIVETAQEGMWMIDKNNITTFVNKKMCEILEYTEEEMMGRTNLSFKDEEEQKKALQQIERRKKGVNETHESAFITKSGRQIWTQVSTNPLLNEDGTYNGALAMMTDITEKKQLQQQLLNEQVNKQKEITKAAINAQEKERSDIGEELHDNVNQILAASKLYLGHSLTQDNDNYRPFIIKTQDYIAQAIEEIRKLTKALTGPAKEETMGLVVTVMELLSNISTVKDINFSFKHTQYAEELTDTGLKVVIYRIVQEQVNNILKHADATEVLIDLSNRPEGLRLIVKDNGNGFNTCAIKKGIGLKNIKNRVDVYDGNVEIISSPGNGCTLKIFFKEC